MPEIWLENREAEEARASYASSYEHLSDEMRRLDMLIRLRLLREHHTNPPNLLDQFRGLVLADEEITRLLADAERPHSGDTPLHCEPQEQHELATALSQLEDAIQQRLAASAQDGMSLSLPMLAQLFHLTRFEQWCLIICLAPELDRKYEKLYAYLQDDVTRKKPSPDLVLNLLCQTMPERLAARSVFDPWAPLLKYRLVQITDNVPDSPTPLLQRCLKLDDRIVNCLLGFRQLDARLDQMAAVTTPRPATLSGAIADLRVQICGFLQTQFSASQAQLPNVIFYLYGPYGSGRRALAEAVSHDIGLPLMVGDVEQMLSGSLGFAEAIWLLCREAVLQPAVLCLEHVDGLLAEPDKHRVHVNALVEALRTFTRVAFLLGSEVWHPQGVLLEDVFIALEMPRTNAMTRRQLWESHLSGQYQLAEDVDWGILASNFRLQPGQMHEALVAAKHIARWRSPVDARITMADLYTACRAQSSARLGMLARKIEPRYMWDDIVLPPINWRSSKNCVIRPGTGIESMATGALSVSYRSAKVSMLSSPARRARAKRWRLKSSPMSCTLICIKSTCRKS